MAVIAPAFGAPLLAAVSHLPSSDWRLGAPMFFCAALQGAALLLAWWHFRSPRYTAQASLPTETARCRTTRS